MTPHDGEVELPGGATIRSRGPEDGPRVLFCGGASASIVAGTWSPSIEWIVGAIGERLPELRVSELRYRIGSWKRLGMCIEDGADALRHLGADGDVAALVGFSTGGGVCAAVAETGDVPLVVGLAPWLPPELDLSGLRGRRLAVLHGSLDGRIPLIPGVSPRSSRRGFDRAMAAGATGEYHLIRGAIHPIATRPPWGGLLPMPRADRWADLTVEELSAIHA